ncbi:MAG: hypothetical protein HYZ37_11040 [Candidatus Solibacter usitatus]|nr:hypothetical protein [Candidatus Solibacter usitatus]
MKKLLFVLAILSLMVIAGLAADINGKWVGQVPRGDQSTETTFTFKMEGEKLTGTMSGGQGGPSAIEDGKVSGDSVSFSVTTQRGKRTFTGKVSGNEIKFKREGGQSASEFVAKRAGS